MNHWIQTHTGKRFEFIDPQPDHICIDDIAHALSNKCRFNGHTKEFYSVAQHSILVSEQCETDDIRIKMLALLHDAAEAYMPDFAAPIKDLFVIRNPHGGLCNIFEYEERLLERILEHLISADFARWASPTTNHLREIAAADRLVMYWEKRDLLKVDLDWSDNGTDLTLPKPELVGFSPRDAERVFLYRFAGLMMSHIFTPDRKLTA